MAESETKTSYPLFGVAAVAAGMIAQQVGGKVARDALFLSSFPATFLPRAVVAAAVLSLLAVLAVSRMMTVRGPRRIVPAAFAFNGVVYAIEWALAPRYSSVIAVAIYLHTAAVGGVVISGFWSVVNEKFDPRTARLGVARITTGATLGGLIGGLAAERVGAWLEPRHILLMLCVVNLFCAVGVMRFASEVVAHRSDATPTSFTQGFRPLLNSRYLRNVALVAVTIAVLEVLLEYALKSQAADVYADERSLVQFFAIFYTGAALVTFVVQLGFAKSSLEKLGLGGTLALGPAIVIVSAMGAAIHFELWTIAIAAGLQTVIANSVFRSAYELLYTPVAPEAKRPLKVVIDVALARLGSMVASGLIIVVVVLALPADWVVVALAIVFAAIALALSLRLHAGYVHELAYSLQSGIVALDESDIVDATTRQTLASTTMALDRDRLLAEIAALQRDGDTSSSRADMFEQAVRRVADDDAGDTDRRIEAIRTFTRGTVVEIRERLAAEPLEPHVVPFVIPLLGRTDGELVAAVSSALEAALARISGQLTDAFLDQQVALSVRRLLPRVFRVSDDARVIDALRRGLQDDDFDIRYFSGRALATILDRGQDLRLETEWVLDIVREELSADDATWAHRRRLRSDPPSPPPPHRGLEQVFGLLSLVLEREIVRLSFGAIRGTDVRLRGTALEYLDNVLPADLTNAILARLVPGGDTSPPRTERKGRPAHEVEQDLRNSAGEIKD